MVGPVSNTNAGRPHPATTATQSAQSEPPDHPRGKSVGHLAKEVAMQLRNLEGVDVPKNIQGQAASSLARGMNTEAFLSTFTPATPADGNDGPIAEDPAPADGPIAEPDPVIVDDNPHVSGQSGETTIALDIVEVAATESSEVALQLLEAVETNETDATT